jgi:hypothetical protein
MKTYEITFEEIQEICYDCIEEETCGCYNLENPTTECSEQSCPIIKKLKEVKK